MPDAAKACSYTICRHYGALWDSAAFHNGTWKVVGICSSAGDVHESEAMTDANTLMSATQRTLFSAATVWLDSPAAFDAFKDAVKHDPAVKVDVQTETEYYAGQTQQVVANTVGGITGIRALFGALNTMYSAVSTRTVENRICGGNPCH